MGTDISFNGYIEIRTNFIINGKSQPYYTF